MKKKCLYINLNFKSYYNKTHAQVKSLYNLGIETTLLTIDNMTVQLFDFVNNEFVKVKEISNLKSKRNVRKALISECLMLSSKCKIDFIYVRRLMKSIIFYKRLFRLINTKVVYEIPTFPYDKKSLSNNIFTIFEHLFFVIFIKNKVTIITAILQNDIKNNSKILEIKNGVDFDLFKPRSSFLQLENEFIMVSVAHVCNWHGLDRLLYSIDCNTGDFTIKLLIVSGDTDELLKLKRIVQERSLDDKVTFLGERTFKEIHDIVNSAHIAIGSLGYHRRGGKYDTSLKNKEYCAMGIPFIHSAHDKSFSDDFKYKYKVSSDDEIIDLNKIIEWYKITYSPNSIDDMRDYAISNLCWDNSFEVMIEKLEGEK